MGSLLEFRTVPIEGQRRVFVGPRTYQRLTPCLRDFVIHLRQIKGHYNQYNSLATALNIVKCLRADQTGQLYIDGQYLRDICLFNLLGIYKSEKIESLVLVVAREGAINGFSILVAPKKDSDKDISGIFYFQESSGTSKPLDIEKYWSAVFD